MERNEISIQEVRVYCALKQASSWLTNAELAHLAAPISTRTVRAITLKFVRLQLVDQAEVFPAHRYRLADKAAQRNGGYQRRLDTAAEVFGLSAQSAQSA